jgi:hypothetical protein
LSNKFGYVKLVCLFCAIFRNKRKQKSMTNRKNITRKKYDEVANIVAETFGCGDRYVRAVIADTKHTRYKGEKPQAIRKAYCYYINNKQIILRELRKIARTTIKQAA